MEFNNEEYTKKKYVENHNGGYFVYDYISKFLKTNSLLDIGCGDGYFLEKYKDINPTGIELSKAATEICLNKGLNVKNIPIEDFKTEKKFDAILAVDVLEHVNDIRFVCNKIKNLLSYSGIFIVVLPNPNSLKVKLGLVENPVKDPAHIFCPSFEKAKEIFISCGYNIIKAEGVGRLKRFPKLSQGMLFILNNNRLF